jgi:hydroxymethylbilane synthase
MKKNKLVIGSRGSKLALWQTNYVATFLQEKFGLETEIVKIKTQGDKILDAPLAKIGGKGLFVKEIEQALLAKEIDLAVHSMKDVPTDLPEGLQIKAMTKRADVRDVLISRNGSHLNQLPAGTTIATSSLRRQAQLKHYNSGWQFVDLRGNLDTRLRKMQEGLFDAMILAAAGIDRLGLSEVISQRIATTVLLPAVGQGSIGIETRVDDNFTNGYVAALNDKDSYLGITAERAFLKRLEGGCQVPIGAYGRLVNGQLHFSGLIASLDGSKLLREEIVGSPKEAQAIGVELAERLLARGGDKILAAIRAHSEVIAEFNAKTSGNNGAGF